MFCFRADAGVREIEKHAPQALVAVQRAIDDAMDDLGALRLGASFAAAPKIASTTRSWTDHPRPPSWRPTSPGRTSATGRRSGRRAPATSVGVAREGKVYTRDVSDSYLRSDGRLLARSASRVSRWSTRGRGAGGADRAGAGDQGAGRGTGGGRRGGGTSPARVHRPWGWYQTMDLGERFRVKRIVVKPGKQLSLQKHHHRAEHWVVVRGTAEVTRDDEVLLLRENESVYLPLGCVHRLANPGRIPVEIVEVQTGAYLEEDDIVRIEDDYGRP